MTQGLYRRLVESSPEGVVLIDAQGADHPVIYVNPAFEALTGYSAAELIGRNLRLLQADDREQDGAPPLARRLEPRRNLPRVAAQLPQGRHAVLE